MSARVRGDALMRTNLQRLDAEPWLIWPGDPLPPPPVAPKIRTVAERILRQTLFPFSIGLRYPAPIGPLPFRPSPWRPRRLQLPVLPRRGSLHPDAALELSRISSPLAEAVERPRTRGDCLNMPRPCPFVSCEHHLYLDVNRAGSIRLNFPGLDFDEIGETCSLDVADSGPQALREVAVHMNVTLQRCKQIETDGLQHVAAAAERLRDDYE